MSSCQMGGNATCSPTTEEKKICKTIIVKKKLRIP